MENNKQSIPNSIFVLAGLFVLGLVGLTLFNAIAFSSPEYKTRVNLIESEASVTVYGGGCHNYDNVCFATITVETSVPISVRSVSASGWLGTAAYCDQIPRIAYPGRKNDYSCSSNKSEPSKICIELGEDPSVIICRDIPK